MDVKNNNDISGVDIKEKEDKKKGNGKKRTVAMVIITLIIIIIILMLRSCNRTNEPSISHSVTIDTSAEDKREDVQINPLADRDVYFSGIVDSTITKEGSIQLLNDERNEDFYMMFTVIDSDSEEVIYESNLVPSGQAIYWIPGEYLESGTYNLNFKETPYYFPLGDPSTNPEDYITLSVGNNTVKITIL